MLTELISGYCSYPRFQVKDFGAQYDLCCRLKRNLARSNLKRRSSWFGTVQVRLRTHTTVQMVRFWLSRPNFNPALTN